MTLKYTPHLTKKADAKPKEDFCIVTSNISVKMRDIIKDSDERDPWLPNCQKLYNYNMGSENSHITEIYLNRRNIAQGFFVGQSDFFSPYLILLYY